jgi:hypothetical protein
VIFANVAASSRLLRETVLAGIMLVSWGRIGAGHRPF